MSENVFYVPLDTTSVAHYFGSALIMPANFFPKRPIDIQNSFPDYVLFSRKRWVDGSNCSLQVILTGPEIESLVKLDDNYFLSKKPLPISRVAMILFSNEEQARVTTYNTIKGSAYIPSRLITIEKERTERTQFPYHGKVTSDKPSDQQNLARRFDILLGGFALMKVASLTEDGFPRNYLQTLSYYNKLIASQLSTAQNIANLTPTVNYTGLFSTRETEWSKWLKYVFNDFSNEAIIEAARGEGINIREGYGILQIDNIPRNSTWYDIVLLSQYGEKRSKSLEDLLFFLKRSELEEQKAEQICLLFGLKTGYQKLRNEYRINQSKYKAKYELITKLDYYTIESLYQFTFNGIRENHDFPYLNFIINGLSKSGKRGDFQILETPIVYANVSPTERNPSEFINILSRRLAATFKSFDSPIFQFDTNSLESIFKKVLLPELEILRKQIEIEASRPLADEIALYKRKLGQLENELDVLQRKTLSNTKLSEISDISEDNKKKSLLFSVDAKENFADMEIRELKKLAKERGLTNASKMSNTDVNRKKLIDYLSRNDH